MLRAAAVVLSLSTAALAEPAAGPDDDAKSPALAIGLSTAGTVLPLVMIGAAFDGSDVNVTLYLAGMAGTLIGPSIGHWYAHEYVTPGLLGRGAGAALAGIGAAMSLECIGLVSPCETTPTMVAGEIIGIVGIAVYAGSTLYDIATAGRVTRAWNDNHIQIAPTVMGSGATRSVGLSASGSF